ncbi:MAG: hypothetical protein JNJ61_17970 [Anaerolineae bacterium]|nr:hypothetical protein [Anaerolineae bacterium]
MATKELTPQIDTILAAKRQALNERKSKTPIEAVRALASMQKRPLPFLSAIAEDDAVTLVGQVRYGEGVLAYDPVTTALDQARAGANAIALFTDESLYAGGLDDLVLVSRAVSVPVVSQDYFFDEYQIVEARAAGASALVLRASLLEQSKLRALVSATQRNRMTAIVEVRTPAELNYALSLSPYVIGICPQDFRSENPLAPEWLIRPLIPHNIRVMVTEGLHSLEAVQTAVQIGADAVLVDAALLEDPGDAAELQNILRRSYSNPF